MSSVTQIVQAIHAVFDPADGLARATGLVQRERLGKLTGKRFLLTQVFGLLQPGEQARSDLSHFARHSGMSISEQGLQQRFTREAALFLQEELNVAFTQIVAADPVAIPLLRRFKEVIVEDSTTFRLPDECRDLGQGCGGSSKKGTQSAFKVQVRWDLLSGAFKGLALQDGRTPDNRSPLKGEPRGATSVRDSDLGYFDTTEFAAEAQADEYFFSRYKDSVKLYDESGKEVDVLELVREQAAGQTYQCQVQVGAEHRVQARLIAIPVPEEVLVKRQADRQRTAQKHGRHPSERMLSLCGWTIVLTNIPQEELSVPEAVVLLRLRWQVELLFKLWKQVGQADVSRSEQPWHVLCDIYAKLVGLVISHWLLIVGCWHVPSRSMGKATKAIQSNAVLIARAMSGKGDLQEVLQEIVEGLETCCMDSRRALPNAYQLMSPRPAPARKEQKQAVDEVLT